jgi:hypothetical protein
VPNRACQKVPGSAAVARVTTAAAAASPKRTALSRSSGSIEREPISLLKINIIR